MHVHGPEAMLCCAVQARMGQCGAAFMREVFPESHTILQVGITSPASPPPSFFPLGTCAAPCTIHTIPRLAAIAWYLCITYPHTHAAYKHRKIWSTVCITSIK